MNKWYSYLNSAQKILNIYDGSLPFHHFIKQYFKQFKKYGSKDRKWITHLCYCHFRMGATMNTDSIETRILAAHFLTTQTADALLEYFKPDWYVYLLANENAALDKRMKVLKQEVPTFNETAIFPYMVHLGNIVDKNGFSTTHLIQPDVFVRIRGNNAKKVAAALKQAGVAYQQANDTSLIIPPATKLDGIVALNKEVVIQDLSSQKVANVLEIVHHETKNRELSIWDCCAASGGKAILARDVLGNNRLVVSDIRTSILKNLLNRLNEAELGKFDCFATDLAVAKPKVPLRTNSIDLVIADVPCSGSGTWSRTPEQLLYFDATNIEYYSKLQKQIVDNVLPYIAHQGYLLYITCSVFEQENEHMVAYLTGTVGMELVYASYFEGYQLKADTLFAALLKTTNK